MTTTSSASTRARVTADEVSHKAALEGAFNHLHDARQEVSTALDRLGHSDAKLAKCIAKAAKRVKKAERKAHKRLQRIDTSMYQTE